jgi:GAF domain-containing protein
MYDKILRAVRDAGFDRARLYLLSADRRFIVGKAQFGTKNGFVGERWPLADNNNLKSLLKNRRAVSVKRMSGGELPHVSEGPGKWAWMPLTVGRKIIGGLVVTNRDQRRDHIAALSPLIPLIAQAATAIENGRSLWRMKRKAQALDAVLRISARINSSLNLEIILGDTCRAAKEMIGVDHSGFVLFDPELKNGTVYAEFPPSVGTVGGVVPLDTPAGRKFLKSPKPLVIPDTENEPTLGGEKEIFHKYKIRSTLIVPVMGKTRILGSFGLDSIGKKREFTGEEVELCQIFAEQVAVAVENARLFEEIKQQTEQLEDLRRKTLDITSLQGREALRTIVQHAVGLLKAKSGGIYGYDARRGELTVITDHNRQENVGKTLKLGEGLAGRLVESGKPFAFVDDYNAWEGKARGYSSGRRFGAVLEVPLKWKDETVGVLYIDDQVGRKFTPEDARLLGLFADQAAITLCNAELLLRGEGKLKRQEMLSHATRRIMENLGTATLDERLALIAEEAAKVLEAETCGVFLVRDGLLSLEASYGHRAGAFKKGMRLPIRSGPKSGLTGHIAAEGVMFNKYGESLTSHDAVSSAGAYHTPSGKCYSILALPLYEHSGGKKRLIGLLRVDNKRGHNGETNPALCFTEEDEWIMSVFAETAIVAIGNTVFVEQLRQTHRRLSDAVGLLEIGEQREKMGEFTQQELSLVNDIAAQTKILTDRMELFKSVESRLKKVSEVRETTERVASSAAQGQYEATLNITAQGTRATLGSDVVILYTCDQRRKLNYPPAYSGELLLGKP